MVILSRKISEKIVEKIVEAIVGASWISTEESIVHFQRPFSSSRLLIHCRNLLSGMALFDPSLHDIQERTRFNVSSSLCIDGCFMLFMFVVR